MNKNERKEQVVDWKGKTYTLPLSNNERKKWTEDNLSKLSHLEYYFILVTGCKNPIKVPLDKYRKKYEEEYGTKF